MTVRELIAFLQTQAPDLPVAYECCSEWNTLEAEQIKVEALCYPRPDGWIHDKRPDKPLQDYLVLPGN